LFLGLAVASLFVVLVVLASIVKLVPQWRSSQQLIALPFQLLLYLLLYFALWLIFRLKYRRPLADALGWNPSRIPAWQAVVGGGVLSLVVGLLGSLLRTPSIESPFDRFLHSPGWIILFAVFAIALGPLFEELIFRGFLQPLLTRDLGRVLGILITAAAFGALHGPEYSGTWQYIALVSLAGVCFGWARNYGRSLIPAVYMHASFNAVFFFASIAQNQTSR
jgi:CAAX protease family protein